MTPLMLEALNVHIKEYEEKVKQLDAILAQQKEILQRLEKLENRNN
jgi:hypothetical protein